MVFLFGVPPVLGWLVGFMADQECAKGRNGGAWRSGKIEDELSGVPEMRDAAFIYKKFCSKNLTHFLQGLYLFTGTIL